MELREFIVLSFVSDQGPLNTRRLARPIGLDIDMTSRCTRTLVNAGLLRNSVFANTTENIVFATNLGSLVAKKLLDQL